MRSLNVIVVALMLVAFHPQVHGADKPKGQPALGKERTTVTPQPETQFSSFRFQFAPDAALLTSHEGNASTLPIILWDVATGKELKKLDFTEVGWFAFSPDQQTVVGRAKGRISLWDVNMWRERTSFGKGTHASCLAFSRDGKRLATGHSDSQVRVWDVTSEKELFRATADRHPISKVALSPDGTILFSRVGLAVIGLGKDWPTAGRGQLFHIPGGEVKAFKPVNALSVDSALTPDGKKLLTCDHAQATSSSHQVQVWDTASGLLLTSLKHAGVVRRLAVAPNKNVAATYSETLDKNYKPTDWVMTIWDLDTGKELDHFKGHKTRVHALLFSPDGQRLASYSADGDVKVWDLANRTEANPPLILPGPQSATGISAGLAFTADGRSPAAWSGKEAKVWLLVGK